jgi:hypothetical protein
MTLYCTQESAVPRTTSIIPVHFLTNQRQELVQEEELNIPQYFAAEKRQELEPEEERILRRNEENTREGMRELSSNDANTKLICTNSSMLIQSVFFELDNTTHEPRAEGNTRDEYSRSKAQESGKRVYRKHPTKNAGQRSQAPSYCMFPIGKPSLILLLMMLSILGVVQALTGCQIVHDWLPDIFNGSGTACCDQIVTKCYTTSTKCGITCVDGRITQM